MEDVVVDGMEDVVMDAMVNGVVDVRVGVMENVVGDVVVDVMVDEIMVLTIADSESSLYVMVCSCDNLFIWNYEAFWPQKH